MLGLCRFVLVFLLIFLVVPVDASVNATNNTTPLDILPVPPPELSDTGYTLSKGELIICKLPMPEAPAFWENSKYGGGVGVGDIRVYTVADRSWFGSTPLLRVFSGDTFKKDQVLDNDAFGKNIEICIAYLDDGTVKVSYRYGEHTRWMILYAEVAGSSKLTVKGSGAFDFEKQLLNPPNDDNGQGDSPGNGGIDHSTPYPTPTSRTDVERETQEKYNLALAGFGGLALALLVMSLYSKKGRR